MDAELDRNSAYDSKYDISYSGVHSAARSDEASQSFFSPIADAIVLGLKPRSVFDAGCAVGILVEMLWDRGVEVRRRDISVFTPSNLRPDMRPWCEAGSLASKIEGSYDLVLCTDVLENVSPDEALAAIRNITAIAPQILFSSSPIEAGHVKHVNVRPTKYWLERFAECGFAPVIGFDATFLCPHAMLLERTSYAPDERITAAFVEIVRQRLKVAEVQKRAASAAAKTDQILSDARQSATGRPGLSQEFARSEDATAAHEIDGDRFLRTADPMRQLVASTVSAEIAKSEPAGPRGRRGGNWPQSSDRWSLARAKSLLFARSPFLRRVIHLAWWTITLQLPQRLRLRRQHIQSLRLSPNPKPDDVFSQMLPIKVGTKCDDVPTVRALIRSHEANWSPLPVFNDHRAPPTLTILTDGVDPNSLFGGVGTAMVIGVLIAKRMGARLRLATRHRPPDPSALGNILRAHRIAWDGATEFIHIPLNDSRPLAIGDKDLFLTTSWWTTRSALSSVDASRILYLLQEDERMFYPFGDLRLRCNETLSDPNVRVLVNTRLLFDHLADGPEPVPLLRERGYSFEPAFPAVARATFSPSPNGKLKFFFYARPNNDRNLYWRGLAVIEKAMQEGLLSPDQWDIAFVGNEIPPMRLPGDVRPANFFRLPWQDYAELVSQMDLGLCLMDTPHPSYPPFDLAAAGAVVVTNTHGVKVSLETFSRNIIAVSPDVGSLLEGLRRAIPMARDADQRAANRRADNILRDWDMAVGTALDQCLARRV